MQVEMTVFSSSGICLFTLYPSDYVSRKNFSLKCCCIGFYFPSFPNSSMARSPAPLCQGNDTNFLKNLTL